MEQDSGIRVFRPSWKNYILNYLFVFVLAVLMVVIGFSNFGDFWKHIFYVICGAGILVIVFKILLDRCDECLTVKEKEITMEHGLLSKKSTEIDMSQIKTIQVHQRILQRILNLGDIFIASSGTGDYEIMAHGMSAPHEIRDHIQSLMRTKEVKPENAQTSD